MLIRQPILIVLSLLLAWSSYAQTKTYQKGTRSYECANHLGNVVATVADKPIYTMSDIVASTNSYSNYYPYGMPLVGRNESAFSYRYGFNGMEQDGQIKGSGNSLDFGARIYDPRLARWLSLDPLSKKYPMNSDYAFVDNSPIYLKDLNGEKIIIEDASGNTYEYTPGAETPQGASDFVKFAFESMNQVFLDDVSKNEDGTDMELSKTVLCDLSDHDDVLKLREAKDDETMSYWYGKTDEKVVLPDGTETTSKLGVITVEKDLEIETKELKKNGNPYRKRLSGNRFKAGRLLFHEILHGHHKNFDKKQFKNDKLDKKTSKKLSNRKNWVNREEKRTVLEMNNITGVERKSYRAVRVDGKHGKKSKKKYKHKHNHKHSH